MVMASLLEVAILGWSCSSWSRLAWWGSWASGRWDVDRLFVRLRVPGVRHLREFLLTGLHVHRGLGMDGLLCWVSFWWLRASFWWCAPSWGRSASGCRGRASLGGARLLWDGGRGAISGLEFGWRGWVRPLGGPLGRFASLCVGLRVPLSWGLRGFLTAIRAQAPQLRWMSWREW